MAKFQGNKFWPAFTPKIVIVWREGQIAKSWRDDALAGLTVAIVALPLAMALGIASGASPINDGGHQMDQVPYIDSSGAGALLSFVRQAQREGTQLILCDLREQPQAFLGKLQPAFLGAERAATFQSALDQIAAT